jgi:alpha-tubulin suppressor-like RCC1 family protein
LVELLKDQKVLQVECGKHHTFAVSYNERLEKEQEIREQVYAWGSNSFGQLGIPEVVGKTEIPLRVDAFLLSDISINKISCGASHTLFVSDIGKVYACGSN